jgi:signal transduction histidine kinase
MRHLYLKVYLAFIGVAFFCVLVAAIAARIVHDDFGEPPKPLVEAIQLLAESRLPDEEAPAARQDEAVEALAAELSLQIALWSSDGRLLGDAGSDLPPPDLGDARARYFREHHLRGLAVRLDDGRWLLAGAITPASQLRAHFAILAVLAGAMALGCYPVARQITRRLEGLQRGVERWGSGDLTARVAVSGLDEVATVARSFNAAAARVEALVEQQKRVLANASHELRSPLARLRMALELLEEAPGRQKEERRKLLEGAAEDIEELDALVGDILLASKLEGLGQLGRRESVDLLELLQREGERFQAEVSGEVLRIDGDPAMLARALRNLLENAARFSDEVQASVERADGHARLVVADRGPGVPEGDRQKIFQRFYRPRHHSKGYQGGVGLGLALVKQIAELHGGTVRCLPREGGGSRFEVDLPLTSG